MADDYFIAMARVEQRLQLAPSAVEAKPSGKSRQTQLDALIDQLSQAELSDDTRLDLVRHVRQMLDPFPSSDTCQTDGADIIT